MWWRPPRCSSLTPVSQRTPTSAPHHSTSWRRARACPSAHACVLLLLFCSVIAYACQFCCWFICVLGHVHDCARHAFGHLRMCTHTHTNAQHTSISSIIVLTVLSHAWTSPPFPHIYAKPGSCQSVTLVTLSPTSPIRADRAGLGGGRAPANLPTCQSHTGHPHACLPSDPISVCQTAWKPSPWEESRRGGGDLIRINYASPHRLAVLLIHERDERKMRREREWSREESI